VARKNIFVGRWRAYPGPATGLTDGSAGSSAPVLDT
jgi:hypothetical protein